MKVPILVLKENKQQQLRNPKHRKPKQHPEELGSTHETFYEQ